MAKGKSNYSNQLIDLEYRINSLLEKEIDIKWNLTLRKPKFLRDIYFK